jgi:hypothetical protein
MLVSPLWWILGDGLIAIMPYVVFTVRLQGIASCARAVSPSGFTLLISEASTSRSPSHISIMGLFSHTGMHACWASRASIISYPIDYTYTHLTCTPYPATHSEKSEVPASKSVAPTLVDSSALEVNGYRRHYLPARARRPSLHCATSTSTGYKLFLLFHFFLLMSLRIPASRYRLVALYHPVWPSCLRSAG